MNVDKYVFSFINKLFIRHFFFFKDSLNLFVKTMKQFSLKQRMNIKDLTVKNECDTVLCPMFKKRYVMLHSSPTTYENDRHLFTECRECMPLTFLARSLDSYFSYFLSHPRCSCSPLRRTRNSRKKSSPRVSMSLVVP